MRIQILISFVLASLISPVIVNANPDPPVKEGKTIFMARCAACHNVNQTLTGPALAGVDERRSIDWIINFVHSSQTMIKKGDKDAVALYQKFNKIPMPDHSDLSDENIKSIVEYIKSEAKAASAEKANLAKPATKKSNNLPISLKRDFWPLMGVVASVLLLVGTLLFAAKVISMKKEFERKKLAGNL